MEKNKYTFGEKKQEYIDGKNIPVEMQTPKYKEAKKKIIELLESNEYKDVLEESDFWILVNTYANKTKAMYSGLIISHDGCLKINDKLEDKLKFKPECMTLDKEGYNDSLVYTYICSEQGLYEVGEVSKTNCKNAYPYAMALKRCFDRVVLKNSKIAYNGVYSDSEADEFAKREQQDTKKQIEELKEAIKSEDVPLITQVQKDRILELYTKEEIKEYLNDVVEKSKLSELTVIEADSFIRDKVEGADR